MGRPAPERRWANCVPAANQGSIILHRTVLTVFAASLLMAGAALAQTGATQSPPSPQLRAKCAGAGKQLACRRRHDVAGRLGDRGDRRHRERLAKRLLRRAALGRLRKNRAAAGEVVPAWGAAASQAALPIEPKFLPVIPVHCATRPSGNNAAPCCRCPTSFPSQPMPRPFGAAGVSKFRTSIPWTAASTHACCFCWRSRVR